tara:strand:- start:163 stop:399 length:237 start_codon:yes stop_codon:yes gene_type:complete
MIGEAVSSDTKNALKIEPLDIKSPDKVSRISQFRNISKYNFRRWIWQQTRLEVEMLFFLLLLGTVVIVMIWYTIGEIG